MAKKRRNSKAETSRKARRKIRYAVVGLGHIAQNAVLPAFKHSKKNSELVALVSGDEEKLKKVGRQYIVKNLYTYNRYGELLKSGLIDAVYIALPNDKHCDYAIRAARAGIHVLCEKPLGMSADECDAMIKSCDEAGVKLMTAYRLHFDRGNLGAIKTIKSGKIGDPRFFVSSFSFPVQEDNIRIDPVHGGGPVYDIGIYCINASRYLFQQEPTEVFAMQGSSGKSEKLDRVGETFAVTLRYPEGRLASFTISYGAAASAYYEVVGTKGDICLDNAFEYQGEMEEWLTVGGKTRHKKHPPHDQFAPELIYFSECVLKNRDPEPSGVEGYADLRIIDAIFQSIEEQRPVVLKPFNRIRRPGIEQKFEVAPAEPKPLVKVQAPQKKAA